MSPPADVAQPCRSAGIWISSSSQSKTTAFKFQDGGCHPGYKRGMKNRKWDFSSSVSRHPLTQTHTLDAFPRGTQYSTLHLGPRRSTSNSTIICIQHGSGQNVKISQIIEIIAPLEIHQSTNNTTFKHPHTPEPSAGYPKSQGFTADSLPLPLGLLLPPSNSVGSYRILYNGSAHAAKHNIEFQTGKSFLAHPEQSFNSENIRGLSPNTCSNRSGSCMSRDHISKRSTALYPTSSPYFVSDHSHHLLCDTHWLEEGHHV